MGRAIHLLVWRSSNRIAIILYQISKSFISFLIGCVRRPTPRTDKGSSSITNNMITFNGISVLNFEFKRYSLLPNDGSDAPKIP
jgi:hypothetical protein